MNYKTIQLALRELLYSHAEDGGSLVLADLNEYVKSIVTDYEAAVQRHIGACNKIAEYEKRDEERLSAIKRLEDQLESIVNPQFPKSLIEETSLGTIVLTKEEKDKIKWIPNLHSDGGYWEKISAIKSIRERTSCGLIEAKDAVEYWLTEKNHLGHGKYYWANGEGRVELNMTIVKS